MQLTHFQIIDDVMNTSLKQREMLDIDGWMTQSIWIHQTRVVDIRTCIRKHPKQI